jgi:hypothetical protein
MNWLTKLLCSNHFPTREATQRELAWHIPNYCMQSQQMDISGHLCAKCDKLVSHTIIPKTQLQSYDPVKYMERILQFKTKEKEFNWYHC